MDILHFSGIETDEAEIELFHAWNVPLQGLQYHVVAGRYVHGTAQALLRAYQDAVDGGVEFSHDTLPFFEGDISLDHIYRSVRKMFPDIALIQVKCRQRGTSDGYLARYFPYKPFDIPGLGGIPVAVIPLYQVRYRAGLDKQFDLPHESQPCILFRVSRAVVVQFADAAEFLDDDTVYLVFSFRGADGMCPYPVFLTREVTEFAGDDRLADKFGEFVLVVHVLVLFLDAEYSGFPRTVAGTEKDMPPEGGERCSVIRVVLFLYLVVPVFVVDLRAPAYHVHRIVVEQFELAVQFRDVVAGGRSRVENLVFEPSEYAQDVSCTLRCGIGDFV